MSGRPIRLIVLAGLVLGAAACGRDMSDLQSWIANVHNKPGEPIPPLPSIETPPSFEYQAFELRDPFSGGPVEVARPELRGVSTAGGPAPDPNRRREVLEGFELDSLEMVGTLQIQDSFFGLIEDPDGLIHRVREENYMGRNHGRIVAVYDDRIELVELVPDGSDAWAERRAEIALDEE